MLTLAIDPGNRESAYVITEDNRPREFAKLANEDLLDMLREWDVITASSLDRAVIEMVASYGMAVGADVFETCVWAGRFAEALAWRGGDVELITRRPVKLHHCQSARAKDANITQALVDRFAPGTPNHGKGTKAAPGWFYGFKADIWQAYALAVYATDTHIPTLEGL